MWESKINIYYRTSVKRIVDNSNLKARIPLSLKCHQTPICFSWQLVLQWPAS